MISYVVRVADVRRHYFEVDCRLDDAAPIVDFTMPSWIPGSYLLREYARHVVAASAYDQNDAAVVVEKINKNTWRCHGRGGALIFRLCVFALDESVRGAFVDSRRAYFNGPCLFVVPNGRESESARVTIEAPTDPVCATWRVATTLPALETDERGFGIYTSQGHDELLDHPFEISNFEQINFDVRGVPHSLVVSGRHDADLDRVATDLRQVCATQIEFFGEPAPFSRYMFLCLVVGNGYGGLEHRTCSSLIISRSDLPVVGELGTPKSYQKFLSLASHEYFHTWHIKRIKPAKFMPYELSRRNHTRLLWVFEGITSYYQDLFLVRSGLIDSNAYLRRLGVALSRVFQTPGRHLQTLDESSFNAWDVLYKPESNSPNASISYYSKGALVALALDLKLRLLEDRHLSLDFIMQQLWRRFGSVGVGVPEDGFEALVCEFAGEEFRAFFDATIRGLEDPALGPLFQQFGISMQMDSDVERPSADGEDESTARPRLWLGLSWREVPQGLQCTNVLNGGPAEAAGINSGDLVLAIDRLRVSGTSIESILERYAAGDTVPVALFRQDELLECELTLERAPATTCRLVIADDSEPAAIDRRQAWINELS